jgi:hypothetical protein
MVPAAGLLGAARLAPSGSPALNLACGQVVEPDLFYVAGSTDRQLEGELLSVAEL